MDDELFMADSSQFKPEESSSDTILMPHFGQLFNSTSSKSRLIAYHMLKSLLQRILYKYATNHNYKIQKLFLR